jgi:cytochrome c
VNLKVNRTTIEALGGANSMGKSYITLYLLTISVLTLFGLTVSAATNPTLEQGRNIFNNTSLGSNGKSCAVCHPNGKGLDNLADYGDGELTGIINHCIRSALEGKELEPASMEMKSLIEYMRSLGKVGGDK